MVASFTVTDRRRVTTVGAVRPPTSRSRPAIPHRPIRDKGHAVWRHVSTHLERGLQGNELRPAILWTHVWGLALSAKQTHDGLVLLVAERMRPKTLPLQSAILVRSLLEVLGNVMALTSSPKSIKWFLADGYRRQYEQLNVQREIFGQRPDWASWFAGMDALLRVDATNAGLGPRRRQNPSRTIPDWPTPYWLTRAKRVSGRKRPLPVLLRGNRAQLFEEAYRFWYSLLSSFSHQRCAAARMAIFSNAPEAHWEPGLLESNVVVEGLMFYAATMSELEVAAKMPPSTDLRALWAVLWDLDEEAKRLVRIRYRQLLRLPPL
jgi:hypothetical protein